MKRPWCWERLKAEGDDRGWDDWMASPTQWIWVWVNSGSWWWTGKSGMLQSMGLQIVRHDWMSLTEGKCEYSLERLLVNFQYFGHLMWKADSLVKTLMLGKMEGKGEEGNREWDGGMPSLNQWTWTWANSRRQWGTGWHATVPEVTKSRTQLSNCSVSFNKTHLSPCYTQRRWPQPAPVHLFL